MRLNIVMTSTLPHRKMTAAIMIASLCFLFAPGSVRTHARLRSEPQQEKVVVKHSAPLNEPIEIIETSVKAKAITLGVGFEAESDWLKYVTFKVKNRGDKAITFLQIDFDFPETKAVAGAMMMHQLLLGQRPDFKSTLKNPPLFIKPGETIEISLEAEHRNIKRLIEPKLPSVENINQLVIRTGEMTFEDGTLYSGGFLLRRNPDTSNWQKWLRIGDARVTWKRQ